MTITILGASGRMGSAVANLFARELANAGIEETVIGTYHNAPLSIDGVQGMQLNANDEKALAALCAQSDTVIDCLGPSAVYGERVSRVCDACNTPLISLGHVHTQGARGQILQAGAIPGFLAGAFLLADTSAKNDVEMVYEFNGTLTPAAAHDILATDYSDGLDTSYGTPRATSVDTTGAIPYADAVTWEIAQRHRIEAHAFSIWPQALLEAFRAPTNMELDRRALSMSAASTLGYNHDTLVHIITNPGMHDQDTITLHIPSLYELSAAGAWLAWRESSCQNIDAAKPFALIVEEKLPCIIERTLQLSGGWISHPGEDEAEEGEL
ncbi:saccharopine dehydrogenase NADP-binding domain-containing protein [Denitrobacterium detoxificans]|uniref:saccharopine dehydrogenase NADP-binding domain-containing protein n=1 Tax=Denitrobacterium detoxificans TaxID=79604 RepID=UPI0026F03AE7|nr:saccharopine dehydrogenase NADP-binding domain-containing protein [Denitrobacterium detoxificans]MBE6465415.1 hypothetical protein [Denitrobacterium detoxificans]